MRFPPTRHPGEGRDLVETHGDFSSRDPGLRRGDVERRRKFWKRRQDGFTLVELMVVLVILGLLATIVIVNVLPAADQAKVTTARTSVTQLEQAIEMYNLNNRRYPTSEEGLQALVASRLLRRLDNDPWGNDFVYRLPGRNGRPFDIYSLGADGREGGTGDNADIFP